MSLEFHHCTQRYGCGALLRGVSMTVEDTFTGGKHHPLTWTEHNGQRKSQCPSLPASCISTPGSPQAPGLVAAAPLETPELLPVFGVELTYWFLVIPWLQALWEGEVCGPASSDSVARQLGAVSMGNGCSLAQPSENSSTKFHQATSVLLVNCWAWLVHFILFYFV